MSNSDKHRETTKEDDVNQQLLDSIKCFVCDGFLIDAVVITICGHTFCCACATKKLQEKSICPKCEAKVDLSSPITVKPDPLTQEIVYRMVPETYWKVLEGKKKQYNSIADKKKLFPRSLLEISNKICGDNELISFMLEYVSLPQTDIENKKEEKKEEVKLIKKEVKEEPMDTNSQQGTSRDSTATERDEAMDTEPIPSTSKKIERSVVSKKEVKGEESNLPTTFRRYFRCPASVQIKTLKKLLKCKLYLDEVYNMHFFSDSVNQQILDDNTSLKTIVCRSGWKRHKPLAIYFTLQKVIAYEEAPPMLEAETMPELMAETPAQAPPTLTQNEEIPANLPSFTVALDSHLKPTNHPIITHGITPVARKKRKLSSPTKKISESSSGNGGSPPNIAFYPNMQMQAPSIFPQMMDSHVVRPAVSQNMPYAVHTVQVSQPGAQYMNPYIPITQGLGSRSSNAPSTVTVQASSQLPSSPVLQPAFSLQSVGSSTSSSPQVVVSNGTSSQSQQILKSENSSPPEVKPIVSSQSAVQPTSSPPVGQQSEQQRVVPAVSKQKTHDIQVMPLPFTTVPKPQAPQTAPPIVMQMNQMKMQTDYNMLVKITGQPLGKIIEQDLKKTINSDDKSPNQLRLPTVPANSADKAFFHSQFASQQIRQVPQNSAIS